MVVVDNEDAFDLQNTCELRNAAYRFAKSRVRYIRNAGQPIPKNYAAELVDEALIDTRLGIVRWDPARCELRAHIHGVIRARTAKEARRARRLVRIPICSSADDFSADCPDCPGSFSGSFSGFLRVEDLPERVSSSGAVVGLVLRVAVELKLIAHGDANAQVVLDCWQAGIVEPDAVMAHTGLTVVAYKAARRRLLSLSKRLTPELTEAAREVLRSVS